MAKIAFIVLILLILWITVKAAKMFLRLSLLVVLVALLIAGYYYFMR